MGTKEFTVRVVLVHGGWQGGWAWDGVVAALEQEGHEAWAPTLEGLGNDDSRAGVTLSSMSADLVKRIKEKGWDRFVLVGHSGGGPIIQLVAEELSDRIERAIFVDAWVLEDGESINSILPAELAEFARGAAAASPDQSVAIPAPLFMGAFLQDASEDLQKSVESRLVPTPGGWLDEPIHLRVAGTGTVPSGYIFLEQDQAVPSDLYRASASRLTNPVTATSPGSHEAMLTRPAELASAIVTVMS